MNLPPYKYNGARSMVILHEIEMRHFLEVWKQAKKQGLTFPETGNPDYASLEMLLRHILRAARGYMTWMCENLGLPDPQINSTPEANEIECNSEEYVSHLLNRWREPLKDVPEERFDEVYLSRWKVNYCIDAMLEHAVMHPIRHRFQLETMMKQFDEKSS